MRHTYPTKGVCPLKVEFDLDGDKVTNIRFFGGCNGNLQAIASLVDGMTVDEIDGKLTGIRCGMKSTSCGDQLVRSLRDALKKQK